jgi:hypothetical protein
MIFYDEIVEEVRKARDEHAAKFDYDISAICADIRQKQIENGREIVADRAKVDANIEVISELLKVA